MEKEELYCGSIMIPRHLLEFPKEMEMLEQLTEKAKEIGFTVELINSSGHKSYYLSVPIK